MFYRQWQLIGWGGMAHYGHFISATACPLLNADLPLRRPQVGWCHGGEGSIFCRADSEWIGIMPGKNPSPRPGIKPGPWRGQTVRYIHSPTELSLPGPWRGQTVRYIHSPSELFLYIFIWFQTIENLTSTVISLQQEKERQKTTINELRGGFPKLNKII